MFDVAYQHINGSVDLHDMKGLFHVLRAYFAELMPLKIEPLGTETSEIISKNKNRFHDLENSKIFAPLNSFLQNHRGINLSSQLF